MQLETQVFLTDGRVWTTGLLRSHTPLCAPSFLPHRSASTCSMGQLSSRTCAGSPRGGTAGCQEGGAQGSLFWQRRTEHTHAEQERRASGCRRQYAADSQHRSWQSTVTILLLSTCSDKEFLCRAGMMTAGVMAHSNHPGQVSFLDPCTPPSCFSCLLRRLHYNLSIHRRPNRNVCNLQPGTVAQ